MGKFISTGVNDIFEALHKAGFIKEDPAYVRRVVLDLEYGSIAKMYVELFANDDAARLVIAKLDAGLEVQVLGEAA